MQGLLLKCNVILYLGSAALKKLPIFYLENIHSHLDCAMKSSVELTFYKARIQSKENFSAYMSKHNDRTSAHRSIITSWSNCADICLGSEPAFPAALVKEKVTVRKSREVLCIFTLLTCPLLKRKPLLQHVVFRSSHECGVGFFGFLLFKVTNMRIWHTYEWKRKYLIEVMHIKGICLQIF